MTRTFLFAALASLSLTVSFTFAHENEVIAKVMKDGFKGKTSPLAKVIDGAANPDETKSLAELVKTLNGTKAPKGDQAAYETKVAELIAAMDAVAGGDRGEAAIGRLDKAKNCKACHSDHKPD